MIGYLENETQFVLPIKHVLKSDGSFIRFEQTVIFNTTVRLYFLKLSVSVVILADTD
jgi:hypothetical protein